MDPVPRVVSSEELQRLVSSVGVVSQERLLDGEPWSDLSPVRMEHEPAAWDFAEIVRRFLRPTDRVLDLGTGGGERFIALSDAYAHGVGVDHNPDVVRTANERLPDALRGRVEFAVMDGRSLTFDSGRFDVVLTRHNKIWVEQVVGVLRPGGYFIGQEVGERYNQPIWDAFGWGTEGEFWRRLADEEGYGPLPTMDEYAAEFQSHGCRIVARGHANVRAWFRDIESLVLYLKSVTLPEEFDPIAHLDAFNRYLGSAASPRGYETNQPKDLLVVQFG